MVIGLILIVIGLVFFAQALGYITGDVINVLWPLLVVVLGLALITHKTFGHQCAGPDCCGGNYTLSGGTKKKSKGRK